MIEIKEEYEEELIRFTYEEETEDDEDEEQTHYKYNVECNKEDELIKKRLEYRRDFKIEKHMMEYCKKRIIYKPKVKIA